RGVSRQVGDVWRSTRAAGPSRSAVAAVDPAPSSHLRVRRVVAAGDGGAQGPAAAASEAWAESAESGCGSSSPVAPRVRPPTNSARNRTSRGQSITESHHSGQPRTAQVTSITNIAVAHAMPVAIATPTATPRSPTRANSSATPQATAPARIVHQPYPAIEVPSTPNSSIHSAATPNPAATAPPRTGCGSRYVGRGGPLGKSPDGVRVDDPPGDLKVGAAAIDRTIACRGDPRPLGRWNMSRSARARPGPPPGLVTAACVSVCPWTSR